LLTPQLRMSNSGMATDVTLYERLGGSDAIEAVTGEFYRLVMTDLLLAPKFAGVNMARLASMQAAFLAMAFGGPDGYQGRDLREAHAGLGLGDEHFNRVVALLATALKEAGVGDDDIAEVAVVAETTRAVVLGR
jgi:hemoglobin